MIASDRSDIDSPRAWTRLAVVVLAATIGGIGMWSVVVALPAVQAEFGVDRSDASLPFTMATMGFAFGGVVLGRLSDRFGVVLPLAGGAVALCAGYLVAALAPNLWLFAIGYGLLIGVGSSVSFAPLIADASQWFDRHRGIAVAIAASGNYLAGAIWPPILQHFIATQGWRATHAGLGLLCLATMLPLALLLRRRPPQGEGARAGNNPGRVASTVAFSPRTLQVLLCIAAFACCTAMAMPQVHIVAYCGDLGYGVARGAEMLSLMLGLGIVSRLASGLLADRIGGVATLLIGSSLQGVALTLYLAVNGLTSLYVVSALFGLFQGGIVPMYAVIVRDSFPLRQTGTRVGIVMMASLFGMAFGGWMSGVIFDFTGSYRAAFANGLAWNLLNVSIALALLWRADWRPVSQLRSP